MRTKPLVGPEAASRKYDIITALGCHALANDKSTQKLMLRLITLVTARYNWRLDVLSVGQREIAQLWSVDERTVKREMAKLRTMGWLVLESPARRGRVACYTLDLAAIQRVTQPTWPRVGSDFESRMLSASGGRGVSVAADNVVPFPRVEDTAADLEASEQTTSSEWAQAQEHLRREDPVLFGNWIASLIRERRAGGRLVLRAPSAFHASYVRMHFSNRLHAVLRRIDPLVDEIVISFP